MTLTKRKYGFFEASSKLLAPARRKHGEQLIEVALKNVEDKDLRNFLFGDVNHVAIKTSVGQSASKRKARSVAKS